MTQRFDFSINQGADFKVVLNCVKYGTESAADFSGCRAAMQLRQSYGAEPSDTLSSDNGRITFDGGKLMLSFPHEVTEQLTKRSYLYDVKIETAGGERTRLIEGTITVSKGVTHDVL